VSGCRARGSPDRHRRRRWNRRAVAATDDALRGLEAREGDDLLGVRGAIESHDRGLAEHGLDAAQRPHGVVADRGAGPWPRVRGQPDALADGKRRRGLLLGAGGTPGLRTRRRPGGSDWCRDLGLLLVFLLLLLIIIVFIVDDDHNLVVLHDVDLDDVLDDIGLDDLVKGCRSLRFLVGGANGRVGVWCTSGHV
jgi:hypothetical protein